ncbi:hypothetical protein Ancab_025220 [Ancistrocladus abbreviatus]
MCSMLMQQEMTVKKVGAFVVSVLLFFALLGVGLEEKKEIQELLSGNQVDSSSDEIVESSAESLWEKCRLELIKLKEICEELGFSTLEISSITEGNTPKDKEENVLEALSVLHSLVGDNTFDCLREENVILPVSGEEVSSKRWYLKHLDSLFSKLDKPIDSRRHLARELLQTTAKAQAPSLAPSERSPPPLSANRQTRPFSPPLPSNSPPKDDSGNSDSESKVKSGDQSNTHVTIVIAVVVTAVVTFFISVVLFVCCQKAFRKGSANDYRDDKPLLSLSLSDSVGSSGKSYVVDSSFRKMGNQSFHDLSVKKGDGSIPCKSSIDFDIINAPVDGVSKFSEEPPSLPVNTNANVPSPPLKPPPGRIIPLPPELPPLKPPPGRAVPLPPEPPASLRPPPGRAGPSPPPPAPPAPNPPSGVASPPPPGPPPPPPARKPVGRAPTPPPLKTGPAGPAPPRPPPIGKGVGDDDASKTKLKPFFWDKVLANPDHSMVWHQLKSGSFQFNEEMIETLFGYTPPEKNKFEQKKESSSRDQQPQLIQIIDSKKAQNLSILLKALNLTSEEIHGAIEEGNELPPELLETLLKMAPTAEEELKLRLFNGDLSQLGPAERFLKVLVDVPFAFKRLEALLFMSTMEEEFAVVKESFTTLEIACKELRSSRLFLKLLEAVLKTGNRMNVGTFRGGAQAFKLDTLLKLSDVKGTDGKTTLLHFVVQEIIRAEGIRAAHALRESQSFSSIKSEDLLEDTTEDTDEYYRNLGLQAVSGVGAQLENVKKAACLDAETLTGTIAKLRDSLITSRKFLSSSMQSVDEENGFHKALKNFVHHAEGDIMWLLEEEKRIMGLIKSTADYFHGNAVKEEGLRLFVIVRDFLIMLEKACREVRVKPTKMTRMQKNDPPSQQTSSNTPCLSHLRQASPETPCQPLSRQTSTETPHQPPSRQTSTETPRQLPLDIRQHLFPAIAERRIEDSSSDDD